MKEKKKSSKSKVAMGSATVRERERERERERAIAVVSGETFRFWRKDIERTLSVNKSSVISALTGEMRLR